MRRFNVSELLTTLRGEDSPDRRQAVLHLVSGVEDALAHAERPQRLELIRMLGEIGGRRAAIQLCNLLGTVTEAEEDAVAEALVCIGSPAVAPLCRTLGEGRMNSDGHAARVLGQIGEGTAALALVKALGHYHSDVRREAGDALIALIDRGYTREVRAAWPSLRPGFGGEAALIERVVQHMAQVAREIESLPVPSAPAREDDSALPRPAFAAGPAAEDLPRPADAEPG